MGAVKGELNSCQNFAQETIETWTHQVKALSKVAQSEPHLSYIVYTLMLKNRWMYFQRTLENVGDLMKPLEEEIRNLVEVITGRTNMSYMDRDITNLPIRYGGLGILNPSLQCQQQ